MARLVPKVDNFYLTGATDSAHDGERKTLQWLTRLPDEFIVYHNVHWTRMTGGDRAFGEIDFAVVNPAGGVLVIEQKNGRLFETGNGLGKNYGGRNTSVVRQLHRNLDGLRDAFREKTGSGLRLDCLLYCPDYRVRRLDAAGLDARQIVDAKRQPELLAVIRRSLEEVGGGDRHYADLVRRFFEQNFMVVPDINSYICEQDQHFNRLNTELCQHIGNLSMSPLRLRVQGNAGCGKTGIAMDYYRQVIEAGRKPLLLCYNRPLREKLNSLLPEGGKVQTRDGLTARFLESQGYEIDYSRMDKDSRFWPDLEEKILEFDIPDEWKFDCLVVDEGQDFDDDALEHFRLFLRDDHDILWLEDPDQNVRGADPLAAAEGFVTYREPRNYRSPKKIARFIRTALPSFAFKDANDLPGFGAGVTGYDAPEEQPKLAANLLVEAMRDGFSKEDIVVLTVRSRKDSALNGCKRLSSSTLRYFKKYDRDGNQIMTEGDIYFESIGRFKGQQAAAVILCDVDPREDRPQDLARLYCGMTRATVRLELLANRANPLYGTLREASAQ